MGYDVILWDVDGTLLDFPYSQTYAISKCLEEIGVTPSPDIIQRYSKINDSWWKRLELGTVTKPELLTGRFFDLFEEFGIKCENVTMFQQHYQEELGKVFAYMENSIDICKSLMGKCRQFIVTNGVTGTQLSKLKLSGFYDIMDGIYISEQIGAPKPDRAFFEKVLESIPEVGKERILIVGDSLSSDILGGNRIGIDTCWYNPNDEINTTNAQTTYIIRQLQEVIKIVED